MNGKELRSAVRASGIKLADISRLAKIPESTIYHLYKKEAVEVHYIEKIKGAGVKFELNIRPENTTKQHPGDTNEAAMIGALSATIQAMQDKIENLQDRYEKDIERIQILLNQQGEMITSLVKKALDQPEGKKLSIVNKK